MSVSAISSSAIANTTAQSVHTNLRQFQQEFLQLGSDLQSGNLTAAKQDYAQLHNLAGEGEGNATTGLSTNNPLVEQFNQLGKDLVSGNISGAQQDYSNLKQNFQRIDKEHNNIRDHVHGFGDTDPSSPAPVGPATPADPGGLASAAVPPAVVSAQAAYNSLLQGIQAFGSEDLVPSFQFSSGSSSVSVSA